MAIDDDGLSEFLRIRNRLFRTAYRMLGSTAAAEDVVQEVWIRWQSTNRRAVHSARAFLTTTVSRLAINVKQSAYSRRQAWEAPCLQEPADALPDQLSFIERADALMLGACVLGRLPPTERAAYILREAFDYPYRDIASVLHVQEANARQLVRRARMNLARRPPALALARDHRELLAVVAAVAQAQDAHDLEALFAPDARRSLGPSNPRRRDWDSTGSTQSEPMT
jgi:RNA polymerase sigma-70 factor (ECF subfamily)